MKLLHRISELESANVDMQVHIPKKKEEKRITKGALVHLRARVCQRRHAGTQFTCFTSTKVQILTRLRRHADRNRVAHHAAENRLAPLLYSCFTLALLLLYYCFIMQTEIESRSVQQRTGSPKYLYIYIYTYNERHRERERERERERVAQHAAENTLA
jgi:hypothetical protein